MGRPRRHRRHQRTRPRRILDGRSQLRQRRVRILQKTHDRRKPSRRTRHGSLHSTAAHTRILYPATVDNTHLPLPEAVSDIGDESLMCLIVSGGHTELVLAQKSQHSLSFRLVGETRDDAAGEAFDKAARAIGLPYPGGPAIQRTAENADDHIEPLPRAWLRGTHEFSFSGLKTAVLNRARKEGIYPPDNQDREPDPATQANIAKAFQDSVVDVLVTKTIQAATAFECSAIILVGGVAANRPLRDTMNSASPLPVVTPPIPLCTDNGAMIARAGLDRFHNGERDSFELDVIPSLRIG